MYTGNALLEWLYHYHVMSQSIPRDFGSYLKTYIILSVKTPSRVQMFSESMNSDKVFSHYTTNSFRP